METVKEEGYPEKLCDQISDAVRDACMAEDPETKVECQSFTKTNMVMVFGEVTTKADVNYEKIVQDACRLIGFKSYDVVLDTDHSKVLADSIEQQIPDVIAQGAASPDKDGTTSSISRVPIQYNVTVNSFSLLAENAVEKYESEDFEAGGYKWKLVVYPNGKKSKNVKDHISFYLSMSDTSSFSSGWEVCAVTRLFLLDQINDEFLILQDDKKSEKRFHESKLEWGFDQFIPLEEFNDASNGYLVEDKCVFGAEVFVKERNICRGERLLMINHATTFKHVWEIKNFSTLDESCQESEVFSAGDHKWKIWLFPKGDGRAFGSHLSMYLISTDLLSVTPCCKIYASYTLQIRDHVQASHLIFTNKCWFSAISERWGWGSSEFVEINKLTDPSSGYLVNDVCLVEAEVTVLGTSKIL